MQNGDDVSTIQLPVEVIVADVSCTRATLK
jgi:hypothetical protein